MPEQLRIGRGGNTAEWAALCSLAELCPAAMDQIKDADSALTVELRINGVETSFTAIINRLKEEAVRWSVERAQQMLLERGEVLQDKLRKLEQLATDLEGQIRSQVCQLFPEFRLDGDD